MNSNPYSDLLQTQNDFFDSNQTKDLKFRKGLLQRLYQVIEQNEETMFEAIYNDIGKSKLETIATETGLIKSEITHTIKHLNEWTAKEYVPTVLANLPASSYIISEPLGTVLIIGAWNYPYLLTFQPLVSAIAAGNTVLVKPSELAVHTSALITSIINENFEANVLHVVEGSVKETTNLLMLKFDKIFFTGSTTVGKIIYQAAAKHLTPVTLELGGKSPAILTADASIKLAAKRLVWGKFLNSGQTCVAPDYLLVDSSIQEQFITEFKKQLIAIYGIEPEKSEGLTRIINLPNFNRLVHLIDTQKVIHGGKSNTRSLFIEPTLLFPISKEHPIMEDEIFGPILPILTYQNLEEAIQLIKEKPKPLALYVFTNSTKTKNRILKEISFGGGGVNEALVHLGNHNLPFGGVGSSGTGNYHGKFGFDNFSHKKAIHEKSNWFEPNIKYPPFTPLKTKLIQWLLR